MRCFVAIELPEFARRALVRVIQEFPSGAAKWCSADQLHVTLKFLAEVDEARLARICEIVAAASATVAPFSLALTACGAFPSADRPRVVYCGLEDAERGCERWLAAASSGFDGLGLPRERRSFTPHVTLGRIRDPRKAALVRLALTDRQPELAEHIPQTSFLADRVTLFESRLQRGGAVYSIVQRAALGG